MQEAIVLSLLRHDKTPQGVECSFFQFGTVGVKFYGYGPDARDAADRALQRQKGCYRQGFAPKPGQMFCIYLKGNGEHGSGLKLYGYTTEVAIMVPMIPDEACHALRDRLRDAGLPSGDLHRKNVGYVVDEATDTFKLVPIDFGWHFSAG